jgi:hypothetical protein
MNQEDILRERLRASLLVRAQVRSPAEVVEWFTAVQAQDYAGAKWALGQRIAGATDALIDSAFQSGALLRTHVMRPTWHFVLPEDLRWLQALTAARVIAASAPYYRQTELDEKVFSKSRKVFEKALAGKRYLTREELAQALAKAKIQASGLRLGLLTMRAELDAVLCSGPRRGKQFTYALVDERVPSSKPVAREEALATLARRYCASHGPALPQDFAWWSGLTVADAKTAFELAAPELARDTVGGKTYSFVESRTKLRLPKPHVLLLPNYDEYVIAYKDHGLILGSLPTPVGLVREHVLANHIVVRDGLVVGGFRRTLHKQHVEVDVTLLTRFDAADKRALELAASRYAEFLGLSLQLRLNEPSKARR